MIKHKLLLLFFVSTITSLWTIAAAHSKFNLRAGQPIQVACSPTEAPVVHTALELFSRDCRSVFSVPATIHSTEGTILIGTIGNSPLVEQSGIDLSTLKNKKEAFLLAVLPDGKLLIAGSDKRGTAYGIMALSRLIGVSPWEWWADATPAHKEKFSLPSGYRLIQAPSVEYRGIFLNDEDWGLTPWSYLTHEPSHIQGQIGPKTHERIFELLLRLRANTFWPAMHECSVPFYFTPGNKETAEKYGIIIGTSHCEPMMRNTNGEWKQAGKGEYNYISNRENVLKFWEERVKELAGADNLYTLGMRGIHDGKMYGVHTLQEQKEAMTRILKDQREMLTKQVSEDITTVPQVFIPYKEVLDVYNDGLKVPEDVTLMWCDDNYGYIRHFPTPQERMRKGGNGIYYHISYWGQPHDYLWLSTTSPALIYQQMKLAYDTGIRKIWILNVGDIKPAEYQIEFFLDMAWNIDEVEKTGITAHQSDFLAREFGHQVAKQLSPILQEYYRLAYICKPEFLGHTRVEESNPVYRTISDLPWSEKEIRERLNAYKRLSDEVERIQANIPPEKNDTYFQLIKYPVQAAAQMNRKLLIAQLARHERADWAESDAAFDSIASLTNRYNNEKWNHIMDFQPRKLPVFGKVEHKPATTPLKRERPPVRLWNGADATKGLSARCENLGYEGKAVTVKPGEELTFQFKNWQEDSVEIEIRLLPNHPVAGNQLRFTLSLDGGTPREIAYQTQGRSEEWKLNVLRNQAIRRLTLPLSPGKKHQLIFKALDQGVVLDQIVLYTPEKD